MGLGQVSKLLSGPDLYTMYGGVNYECTRAESIARSMFNSAQVVKSICTFLSPVILVSLYRRDFFSSFEGPVRWGMYILVFYGTAYFLRACGRAYNYQYRTFIADLAKAQSLPSVTERRQILLKYDFDMTAWPPDYNFTEVLNGEKIRKRKYLDPKPDFYCPGNPLGVALVDAGCVWAAKVIGIPLMYPGCTRLLNTLVAEPLLDGRKKMILKNNGKRYLLKSQHNDSIDTMFLDRRNNQTTNGKILVITCEGNAGFYEVGSTTVPTELGYSVLGWNHPGFGGSTGTPYPDRDAAAVDVVVQFAINKLGFQPSDIVIYGSIGGYTGTWAAMNYPNLRAIVLDATFDDVQPLAEMSVPTLISPVATTCCRKHLDLPVSRQLQRFPGAVLLIRRTNDEIICTNRNTQSGRMRSNLANPLLADLLLARYPSLFDAANRDKLLNDVLYNEWLYAGTNADDSETSQSNHSSSELARVLSLSKIDREKCKRLLAEYAVKDEPIYPSNIGEGNSLTYEERRELVLFLANEYMVDFDAQHNTPLAPELFRIPSQPWE